MRVIPCCPSLIRMVASMRYFAVRTICGLYHRRPRRLAEGLRRAESAPTRITSGRTGVRAEAGIPYRALNMGCRSSETTAVRLATVRPDPKRTLRSGALPGQGRAW